MKYKRGDIVFADNSVAGGSMQSGSRPYVVISNDYNNKYSDIVTVVPLTTQQKKELPTHYYLFRKGKRNIALAEQITCIVRDDIIYVAENLSPKHMRGIEERVKIQLGLTEVKHE